MKSNPSTFVRRILVVASAILSVPFLLFGQFSIGTTHQKNRVIVLTDIEADPDDTQSLVRLLLYSNQFDVKGIVATTSWWQKKWIAPESIEKVIKAYGQVQQNLLNVQQGHGPLGALYPDVAYGMEGDTPAFLSLIPNGLNNAEHPDWGGWGGRYELSGHPADFGNEK